MKKKRLLAFSLAALLALAALPAAAQEFRGRVNGTVTDNTGGMLPGVTVTASSPALIQPQVTVTGTDGLYRLIALPAGVYQLTFELAGFKSMVREGIQVAINQTMTVNMQLEVGGVEETVNVSNAAPVVDTSTTTVGTTFNKELLTSIPTSRDIWASLSQSPGFQMTGYDVGGSHTGATTGYNTYGFVGQVTSRMEGINSTEGTGGSPMYYDFGMLDEFQLSGAGNMSEQAVPGALINVTVKSGGDKFSGSAYGDWAGHQTISDNVPGTFKTAGQKDDNGFFVTKPLTRGNPIQKQYTIDANLGGPIHKGKAWFFYSFSLTDQKKVVLGFDQLASMQLPSYYTVKGTYQMTQNNQLIGYINTREKHQSLRYLSPLRPVSAAAYQISGSTWSKLEWTSIIHKAFLDVLVGEWYQFYPERPTWEGGLFSKDNFQPGRIELTTGQYMDGGASDSYQDQKRPKPQVNASLSFFQDRWGGAHDFKIGLEYWRDKNNRVQDQPFNVFYRDRNGSPSEIDIYNTPVSPFNITASTGVYAQDSWKVTGHLRLNLGLRMDHYTDGWPDEQVTPDGLPILAGDTRFTDFFAPKTVSAATVAKTTNLGPRAGFAYDIRGNGRLVVKGFYGRFYYSSTDTLATLENPVGRAMLRYQFTDLNGNRLLDGPQELGRLLSTQGGAGFVKIDRNIKRPYGDEFSGHIEAELGRAASARMSYVYKKARDGWSEVDLARVNAYTVPVTVTDPGPDGVVGTSDDSTIQVLDRPAATSQNRVYTNSPDNKSDYHTVEFALNRRFRDKWMLLSSFQHTWMVDFFGATSSTDSASSAGNSSGYSWFPNQRRFGRETSTFWNYKVLGRYVLPMDIGVALSWKVQSGSQWGRALSVALPGAGAETIRVESVNSNRAPTVGIADIRIDKTFSLAKYGKVTAAVDIFNFPNAGTVTTFRTLTAANFKEVTSLLDPRIIRLGFRFEF